MSNTTNTRIIINLSKRNILRMSPIVTFPDSRIDEEQQQPFTMEEEEEVKTRHLVSHTPNASTSENNHNSSEQQGRRSIRICIPFPVLIAAFAILALLNFASFYQRHEARKSANESITQERVFLRTPIQLLQMELELDIEKGGQEEKDVFSMYPKCDSPLLSQIGN